jgi:hypothetical protein
MIFQQKYFFLLLYLSLVLCVSCRKEETAAAPLLSIDKPAENAIFSPLDTLLVRAQIRSESVVKQVSVQVYDHLFIPAGPALLTPCSTRDVDIEEYYPLEIAYKEDGEYYVKLEAKTETASSSHWRKFYIYNVPRVLQGLIVHCRTSQSSMFYLAPADTIAVVKTLFSRPADVFFSSISNKPAMVFSSGKYFEPMEAYSLEDESILWSVAALHNPPEPYFTGLAFQQKKLYSMKYDGSLKLYYPNGGQYQSVSTGSGFIPLHLHSTEKYYLVIRQNLVGLAHSLAVFHASTGYMLQHYDIPFEAIAITEGPGDHFYLLGNQNSQGRIRIYELSTNYLWEPHGFSFGKIYAAVTPVKGQLLIASAGGIYWYRYSDNSLSLFSTLVASHLEFDSSTQVLFASSGKKIHTLSFPLAQQLPANFEFPDTVLRFHLKYNW